MICPRCKQDQDKVIRSDNEGNLIRRRRECLACGHRWNTWEIIALGGKIRLPRPIGSR
jgi:transcriptional repressor NrdR